MGEITEGIDALGIFLTGGSSNRDPAASLGGAVSSTRLRGMGPILDDPVPALRIDNVFPASGEGDGTIAVDSDGKVVYTPPGGSAGTPVAIAAGESKIVAGAEDDKAIRVYRESGLDLDGTGTAGLVYPLEGALSHGNVSDAQRIAGVTTYRAVMLVAQGSVFPVVDIRLWMPPVEGAQAVYSLATEVPGSGGSIQTIADETTAPTALTWSTPTTEGSALMVSSIAVGASLGLWIRRVFPSGGQVAVQEDFQLAMKYKGV